MIFFSFTNRVVDKLFSMRKVVLLSIVAFLSLVAQPKAADAGMKQKLLTQPPTPSLRT